MIFWANMAERACLVGAPFFLECWGCWWRGHLICNCRGKTLMDRLVDLRWQTWHNHWHILIVQASCFFKLWSLYCIYGHRLFDSLNCLFKKCRSQGWLFVVFHHATWKLLFYARLTWLFSIFLSLGMKRTRRATLYSPARLVLAWVAPAAWPSSSQVARQLQPAMSAKASYLRFQTGSRLSLFPGRSVVRFNFTSWCPSCPSPSPSASTFTCSFTMPP